MSEPKEWQFDEAAKRRVAAEMERIERAQADMPECVVCGQKCIRLAKDGTCSKVSERSEPHREYRDDIRAGARR